MPHKMLLLVFLHYMQETRMKKEAFIKTTGGSGPSCTKVIKRLAAKISDKKGEQYAHVMGFIRTRLRFSLLRSVLIAVRGVREIGKGSTCGIYSIKYHTSM